MVLRKRLSFYMLLYGLHTNFTHCQKKKTTPSVSSNDSSLIASTDNVRVLEAITQSNEDVSISIEELELETLKREIEELKKQLMALQNATNEQVNLDKGQEAAEKVDLDKEEEQVLEDYTPQKPTAPPANSCYDFSSPPPYEALYGASTACPIEPIAVANLDRRQSITLEDKLRQLEFWFKKVTKYDRYDSAKLQSELAKKKAQNLQRKQTYAQLSDQAKKNITRKIRNTDIKIKLFEQYIQKLQVAMPPTHQTPPPIHQISG